MIEIYLVEKIVREAAQLLLDRTAVRQTREKGAYDYVTAVDEAVQKFIQEIHRLPKFWRRNTLNYKSETIKIEGSFRKLPSNI